MYLTFLCALFPGSGDYTRIFFCTPFTLSIPFTSQSLSPLYPFHLHSPFTSISLSPLSLSLISPSLSISLLLPFFLSLSFSLSSVYHLFGVSNGRFRPCLFLSPIEFYIIWIWYILTQLCQIVIWYRWINLKLVYIASDLSARHMMLLNK